MDTLSTNVPTMAEDTYLFPTSLAQQRLWFLYQLDPQSPAYNVTANMRLTMAVDQPALQASLQTLLARHEVLRTRFVVADMADGLPRQCIEPDLTLPLPQVDLSRLSKTRQQEEAQRIANEEAQQPFDLGQAPLWRARLLKFAEEDFLLLLTFHHSISDGWSLGIIFQELATLYDAFTQGLPSPLPPPALQYTDFAIWQQAYLQQDGFAEHLAYWKQQLAGAPSSLALPFDHARPGSRSDRGSQCRTRLSRKLTAALKALSQQQGCTFYMTLVAAFQCLLSRYSSQDDLVLGTVASGRTLAGTESLLGFFANTIVLRTDLSGNLTFLDVLKRVREVVLQADAHQDLPFDILVRELQPERIAGQNPLFQVMISLDPELPSSSPHWRPSSIAGQSGASKLDLSLELNDHADGLDCTFEFSTDLFEEATILRMARHWQTLLEGVVSDPSQHLANLPLLTEAERQLLLGDWCATGEYALQERCVAQLFEEQVERSPEAIALVFGQQTMSYRELNERANQLAHGLHSLGVGPEVLVGVCLERSPEMIVCLLAILKAGGAYVPLDPEAPTQRLAFQMQESEMPVLLTQERLLARLPQLPSVHFLCLDRDQERIGSYAVENPDRILQGEHLAYVIYTSGSTGQPKGVLIEQRALASYCWSIARLFELSADDHVLQFLAITFDASLEQILPTLLVGARLVLRGSEVWSAQQLLQQMQEQRISVINLTPAYWQQVSQEWVQLSEAPSTDALRLVIIGGDQLTPEALRLWRQTPFGRVRVLNVYGPTETTITATTYDTTDYREDQSGFETIPIGRPTPHRRVYLLDQAGQLVPIGVVGELYIGGELLARGYLKRAELTAERFLADPFREPGQGRLYKSGDLARYRADGMLEMVGRADQQVKIRGFRIELGEIEAVLSQHEGVREVVVVAQREPSGENRLVAYVVAQPGQRVQSQQLRLYLQERLPGYMVPAAYVQLEALPLLATGKVDRRALPVPDLTRFAEEETFVAPKLLIQQQLVQIWEELLDSRPIGIRDNFFYLGGHSLLAARLVSQMERIFGKKVALSTLFTNPTIEQLAEVLKEHKASDTRASIFPVQVGGSRRPFFFLHGDWTGGAFYCFALARAFGPDQPFYVLEPYNFSGLQRLPSFEDVAAAHIEALRTIQPEGPYLLGGFCNGGHLAYEMARQLQAAGERIDFLALITPSVPVQFERMRSISKRLDRLFWSAKHTQANLFLRTRHALRHILRTRPALRHIYRTLRPRRNRVDDFDKLLAIDPRLKTMYPPIDALYNDYIGVFSWLVSRYETGVYPGKITFYWAREEPFSERTWFPVTEAKDSHDIENHIVSGTHTSCLTEHIQELAACLSESLRKVQEETMSESQVESKKGVLVHVYNR